MAIRDKSLRSGQIADYRRNGQGIVKPVYTCVCHGHEFESREILRVHITAYRSRVQKDLAAMVREGGLAQNAWDRLPGESPLAYSRFQAYLKSTDPTTGKRSIIRTLNILGLPPTTMLRGVSNRWNWCLRAELLDQHVERLAIQKHVEFKLKSGREQARLGRRLQELSMRGASSMLADPDRVADMTGNEIAKLADVGVKIERIANNDATSIEDKNVRIVWEGPKPDWAPDDSPALPAHASTTTIEGER
jgi:hypothetical protein